MLSDPTIIDALNHLSWRPPAIVQEIVDVRGRTAEFLAQTRKQLTEVERRLNEWIVEGVRLRDHLWRVFHINPPGSKQLDAYNRLIAAIDQRNEENARDVARLQKSFRRQRKEANAISPIVAAAIAEIAKRSLQLAEQEIEERLDFALFMRALRAEFDPEARGGPTFDEPGALGRYLRSPLAS